jgi:cysteinyl-tRNA synthetase
MAKSAGNILRVTDLAAQGLDPLAYRLLCFGTRYRSEMNFDWDALEGQNRRLTELRRKVAGWGPASADRSEAARSLDARFREAVADDLDLPRALVVLNETVTARVPDGEKVDLVTSWDHVLGLDLGRLAREAFEPSQEAKALIAERDEARAAKDFARSDEIRDRLQAMGLEVMDTPEGTKVRPR